MIGIIRKAAATFLTAALVIAFMPAMSFAATNANARANGMYEPCNVLVAAQSYTSVKVSWSRVANASGYTVSVKASGAKYYKTVKTITKPSTTVYVIQKLAKKKSCSIAVSPYKIVNGKKKFGPPTYVKGYTGLRTPKPFTRTSSASYISTQWKTYDNAAGIEVYRAINKDGVIGDYSKIGVATTRTLMPTSTKAKQTTPLVTVKYKDKAIADTTTLYSYKVRSFAEFGDKVVYSGYSEQRSYFANNTTGKYTCEIKTNKSNTTQVTFALTSDANNYSTYKDPEGNTKDYGTKIYNNRTKFLDKNGDPVKTIMYYSTTGKKGSYVKYTKALTLNAGKTIYIMLSFPTKISFGKSAEKIVLGCDYNGHRQYHLTSWKYSVMNITMAGTANIKSYYN